VGDAAEIFNSCNKRTRTREGFVKKPSLFLRPKKSSCVYDAGDGNGDGADDTGVQLLHDADDDTSPIVVDGGNGDDAGADGICS
jgi:hypothetical protein